MNDLLNDWCLAIATFLPLAGALVMMLLPRAEEDLHKVVALVTTLLVAAVGVWIMFNFDFDRTRSCSSHRPESGSRSSEPLLAGHRRHLLPLILLTMLVVPLTIIYSWNHFPEPHNPKAFLILILILDTGMIGTFAAQDLILFFVFFEVVLLPMYFMIGVWGGEERQYAAIKFFLFTLFGSALMIVSFLALFFLTGAETFNMTGLAGWCPGPTSPSRPRCWCSAACSWASASRCRSSRSTPGCPTPTPRRRRSAR